MKSILSSVITFTAANPGGASQTFLQGNQLQRFLLTTDCTLFDVWSGLVMVAMVGVILWAVRWYIAFQANQQSLMDQVAQQSVTIDHQQEIISEQQHHLRNRHASSERQSVEDTKQLAGLYQELKLANQDIEIFLYKAYHNFLGPIATIRGICNIAGMESKEVCSLDYFDKVSTVADNMHNMLEQLLEVSVIHDRDLVVEPTYLLTFFNSIEQDLSMNTTYHTVRIQHRFSETDQLSFDDFLLRQAIIKIINNTTPFRRASFQEALELTVLCEEQDDAIIITLKDDHLSIPSEVSSDIFRMFYRGTQQANDHGLGLYTARYAMRRMGGDIHLTTHPNYTTFGLRLPKHFRSRPFESVESLINLS